MTVEVERRLGEGQILRDALGEKKSPMKPGPLSSQARTTMNEATLVILFLAAVFYGPWLTDCLVREIKSRKAHYA